jgi:peptidoglycan/xylan/chitin deacetylase (PgdA/CDA1 family)
MKRRRVPYTTVALCFFIATEVTLLACMLVAYIPDAASLLQVRIPATDMRSTAAVAEAAATKIDAQYPSDFPTGIVSINFDDGWKSGFTRGFPILQSAAMPATFYIVSHYLGDGAYMTVPDMLALQAAGEEIGDHTSDHPNLTRLSETQMESQIVGSMSELKADGVDSITTFAYPYGAYNTETDGLVLQAGYAAARTVNNGLNSSPKSDPYHLQARDVTSNMSVAEVEQLVKTATDKKEWLILVFHELNDATSTGGIYSWPAADFQSIVDYLKDNHITVMTNAAVVDQYFK